MVVVDRNQDITDIIPLTKDTRFGCSKTLPREGRDWAYHILQLYEFAGSFQFDLVCSRSSLMTVSKVVYMFGVACGVSISGGLSD